MNGYMAGGIASGIAQASQNIQRGMLQAQEIKNRKELQATQQQQQTKQFEQESNLKYMQLQQMQMQLKQLTDINTKKETYSGYDAYRASNGDVKYLNQMIKNPEIRKHMNGVNGIYKLDTSSQEDRALLKKIGLTDEQIDSEGFDQTRYVKTTRDGQAPGTFDVVDLYGAYAKTGYMNTMRKEEIDDLTLKAKQLQVKQQEMQVGSAEEWLKNNPTKTYQDYLQEGKTESKQTITNASLKDEYANLEVKASKNELTPDEKIRHKVLNKLFSTDSDEKRQILTRGMEITDKYKDKLFDESTEISNDDILNAKLYAQQAGIHPDTKDNRELKDQFNTVKTGRRLVDEVMKLDDEELSRGMLDTGIQNLRKLLSDKSFKELSPEEQKKTLKSINMNTKLGMFLAKYIKSISGTAVAQSEYDRLSGLFSGSAFENTAALKEGVKTFVDELDTQFRDSAQTSLLDNPSTTLDLVKRYKELNKGKPKEVVKETEQISEEKTTNGPKVGDIVSGYKYIGGNPSEPTSWEEVK